MYIVAMRDQSWAFRIDPRYIPHKEAGSQLQVPIRRLHPGFVHGKVVQRQRTGLPQAASCLGLQTPTLDLGLFQAACVFKSKSGR
jgi:hypothetical protein